MFKAGAVGIGVWLLMLLRWIVTGVLLGIGYLISDALYAVGLWPLGAVMRIFLLVGVLGFALYAVYLIVVLLAIPFIAASAKRG